VEGPASAAALAAASSPLSSSTFFILVMSVSSLEIRAALQQGHSEQALDSISDVPA
jgi:hypothetical protein